MSLPSMISRVGKARQIQERIDDAIKKKSDPQYLEGLKYAKKIVMSEPVTNI